MTDKPAFDYGEKRPDGQFSRHPTLPDDQRKAFVRPVRDQYKHVGNGGPVHPTRPLTEEEKVRFAKQGYVLFEGYPRSHTLAGCYWTQERLDRAEGCGTVTTMGRALAETYAAKPDFYGSTFCQGCGEYFPVGEFVWIGEDGRETAERVGT